MCEPVVMVCQVTADGEPPAKRAAPSIRVGSGFKWNLQTLAAAADAVESGGKSPVSALNELGVRVVYSVRRQGGPAHCPSFHVVVTVADLRFEGWGHSKRDARAAAARACLCALLARAGRALPAAHHDFTSDEPQPLPASEFQFLEPKPKAPTLLQPAPPRAAATNGQEGEPPCPPQGGAAGVRPRLTAAAPAGAPAGPPTQPLLADSGLVSSVFGAASSPASHKSPINVLYENYSGLEFSCTFGDGSPLSETQAPLQLSHSMRFKVICQIKDNKFEGYGSSKKLAKLAAARSALAALEEGRTGREDSAPTAAPQGFLHQTLADHIGKLVNEKFNELMKHDLVHSKRKVLAGIVITTHNRIEDARVIAVTTGTKCVSGEHMSVSGRAVNDCHAEVAARRCLQRHLYAQLLHYANQADPSEPIEENDLEPLAGGGYQLKPSRQLHLYVSTAPCGDGRIFSPHEHHHTEPDKHPNRLARGQLRTKIESGEGTIPVKNCMNVVQTWDGVMQGERLLTMSCSDKVARWSVCGLQGALLSRLVRPVYLQSLVLGSLLHPHHLYRAICGRIEDFISSLPPPFHLQRPLLSRAASTEARTPARAPSFSVCWCATQQLPEVINATTGKLESGQPSLLCKQSMFARWHYLVGKLPLLPQDVEPDRAVPDMPDQPDTLLYNEAKQMCPTYQLAKQRLIDAFEKAKLGSWIKRPLEQDQFVCEITDAEPSLLFAWAGPHPAACSAARATSGRGETECGRLVRARAAAGASGRLREHMARVRALRQPLCVSAGAGTAASGYGRRNISASVAESGNHGNVGTRSLSYFNYRNAKNGGASHNNRINLLKNNICSASSRLIQARVKDNNVISHRSDLEHNNGSSSIDVDHYLEGYKIRDSSNDPERSVDDEKWDDAINSTQLNSNEKSVTILKNDLPIKSHERNPSKHMHDDEDIKEITHKISDVCLSDEKKQFWSDFYKSRHARRTVRHVGTIDTSDDISCTDHSNAGNDIGNLSQSVLGQVFTEDTYCNLELSTRDSIRPRGLGAKEEKADESNVDHFPDHCIENRRYRDVTAGPSVNLRETVVKDKNVEILRKPREVRLNNNLDRDATNVEEDGKENRDNSGNVRPSIMTTLTACRESRCRASGGDAATEHARCPYGDIPTRTDTHDYNLNKCNNEDNGNVSTSQASFNNASSKVLQENCRNAQEGLKSALLMRRLHLYENFCTKNK